MGSFGNGPFLKLGMARGEAQWLDLHMIVGPSSYQDMVDCEDCHEFRRCGHDDRVLCSFNVSLTT